ncbi:MAG: hypothetical protein ABSH28_05640 [Acidobacteriota bacterium]|jgi:hypothetical protein
MFYVALYHLRRANQGKFMEPFELGLDPFNRDRASCYPSSGASLRRNAVAVFDKAEKFADLLMVPIDFDYLFFHPAHADRHQDRPPRRRVIRPFDADESTYN